VPRGTPAEIVERLDREVAAGLENASVKAKLGQASAAPMLLNSMQFSAHIAGEIEKWGQVVRAVGAKAD
jgi:tripartite-type tricarboxylate transporter receptor subunit TctC